MNELLMNDKRRGELETYSSGSIVSNFCTDLLSSIPLALAKPILNYQKTKGQIELCKNAIEAKHLERKEILYTMQVLARHGQLTPEIFQQLMVAYTQLPFNSY